VRPITSCRPVAGNQCLTARILGIEVALLFFPGVLLGHTNSVPDSIPPLRPPHGELAPGFWEQRGGWVIVGVVLVMATVALGIWLLRRHRPPKAVLPEVQARKALEPLRSQSEQGAVLSQVSQVLRRYFTAAFALPPEELTTREFCERIAANEAIGSPLANSVSEFLRRCDERKFAPAGGVEPLGAVSQALAFIAAAEARQTELRRAAEQAQAKT
jgi:uncharacterized protein DUF4381